MPRQGFAHAGLAGLVNRVSISVRMKDMESVVVNHAIVKTTRRAMLQREFASAWMGGAVPRATSLVCMASMAGTAVRGVTVEMVEFVTPSQGASAGQDGRGKRVENRVRLERMGHSAVESVSVKMAACVIQK